MRSQALEFRRGQRGEKMVLIGAMWERHGENSMFYCFAVSSTPIPR